MTDADSWLASKRFECARCGIEHDAVLLSPTHEGYRFCCTRCPVRLSASLADVERLARCSPASIRGHAVDARKQWTRIYQTVEARLDRCRCGGEFRFQAVRRCAYCATPLLRVPSPFWDAWPASLAREERRRLESELLLPSARDERID